MNWPSCVLLLSAVLLAGCDAAGGSAATTVSPNSPASPQQVVANATVTYVVDGDTVDLAIDTDDGVVEERVRLIGIDTPETKRPDTPVECFGPEATAFVEQLLPVGTDVRVERDVVGRDDFGRLLGYLYLADDGTFVNEMIVRRGFATPLSIEPNTTFARVMVEAARAAESEDLGLWARCGG
ncbi:MAG: thermonuclease family protein [Actinomycetota bacterium]